MTMVEKTPKHEIQGQAKLAQYGMVCLMSRKGNCSDNASTESRINSFKSERVYGDPSLPGAGVNEGQRPR
jgi:transposase InsO family protein